MTRPRIPLWAALFFTVLAGVMAFHELEHVVQVWQKDLAGASCPNDCRGLLGFAFDIEWVHFAYNLSILVAAGALYLALCMWERPWRLEHPVAWGFMTFGLLAQGYHVVEHTYKLQQWFANGHIAPTKGLLGMHVSLVELHFTFNTLVTIGILGGYVGFGFARRLWRERTPRRLGVAGAFVAAGLLSVGWAWEQRPPTYTLAAGVHEGPLVLDHAQRLVGDPGAIVRGGIRIVSSDVMVKNVEVRGGEIGVEIRGSRGVLLDRVKVRGATMDGINARDSSIVVRRCDVLMAGPHAQGIDISFAPGLAPSMVRDCTVRGGMEGIATHMAAAMIQSNEVSGTSLRAIAMTEMSMGEVSRNDVRDSLGVGIFCGDYSRCDIEHNLVRGTRVDTASGLKTRVGFDILAHYYAWAELEDNDARKVGALVGGHIEP